MKEAEGENGKQNKSETFHALLCVFLACYLLELNEENIIIKC